MSGPRPTPVRIRAIRPAPAVCDRPAVRALRERTRARAAARLARLVERAAPVAATTPPEPRVAAGCTGPD